MYSSYLPQSKDTNMRPIGIARVKGCLSCRVASDCTRLSYLNEMKLFRSQGERVVALGDILFNTAYWCVNPKSVEHRRNLPTASAVSAAAFPNKGEYFVHFYSPPSSRNGVLIILSLRCRAHLPHEDLPQWCFTADVVSSAKWLRWIRRRWSADLPKIVSFVHIFCLPSPPVY